MKKQISILLLLCAACFSSCEETVTMDDSVDVRVDAVIKGYMAELAWAENGWLAEVMTSEGIYRFYMEFTNNNMVTMYTDNLYYPELNGKPKTSTYNIRSLQRPTISFDTYSYLAIINDPDDSISGGTENEGLKTDFEFEVEDYTNGVFNLTGRVNRVPATFRKATAEEAATVKAGGLMDVLNNTVNYRSGEFCYFLVGETHVGAILNSRSVSLSYLEADGVTVVETSGQTRTELNNDVELLKPLTVAGKQLTGFTWDASAKAFSAIVDGTPTLLDAQADPIIPLHKMLGPGKNYTELASLLSMYPSTAASENQFGYLYNQTNAALTSRFNLPLQQVTLNFIYTENGSPRMTMEYVAGGYSGWFTYYLTFNQEEDQFTISKLTFEDDAYGNGALFYSASKALADFWVGKTFKIEWTSVVFGSYTMGQVSLVGGSTPAEFYGACF